MKLSKVPFFGVLLLAASVQAQPIHKDKIMIEQRGDTVRVLSCDSSGDCSVVGRQEGYLIRDLEKRIRNEKLLAGAIATGEVAAIAASPWIGAFLGAVVGGGGALTSLGFSIAGLDAGAVIGLGAGVTGVAGTALLIDSLNPIKRYQSASKLAELLEKKELAGTVAELEKVELSIEKILNGTASSSDRRVADNRQRPVQAAQGAVVWKKSGPASKAK